MGKEFKLLFRTAVIAGLVVSACGEARGSNRTENTVEKPSLTTPVAPTEAAELEPTTSPTATFLPWTPTATLTATSEPTATPEPPPIPEKFVEGQTVEGAVQVDGTVIEMDFTPVTFTPENAVRFNNHEGNLTLVTWSDKYNNEVFQIHDGQHLLRDLPAEALRQFIQEQGGSEEGQMAKLVGGRVTFSQDGKDTDWQIAALQKVEHEDVPVFSADAWLVVDRLVEFAIRDGVPSEFEIATVGGGKIFVFCGRTTDRSQADWYKYSRYALLLIPER
ncbi:MAG: hypothetical protein WAV56_04580 [Microgenomates group bacterium]